MDNQPNQYQDANQQPQVPVTETPTPTKQASLWSKFTGVFRRRKADEKLAQAGIVTSNPERYAGVDFSLQRQNPPREEDLSNLFKANPRPEGLPKELDINTIKANARNMTVNMTDDQIREAIESIQKLTLQAAYNKLPGTYFDPNTIHIENDIRIEVLQQVLQERAASIATTRQAIKLAEPISTSSVQTEIPVINDSVREPVVIPEVKKPKLTLEAIKQRSTEAAKKLASLGCKAADRYNALSVKQKIALGVAFSAAGIATAGATSLITKSLAVGSVARGIYEKGEKVAKDIGRELTKEEKVKLMIKSLSIGGLIGVAGPNLIGELINIIPDNLISSPVSDLVKDSLGTSEPTPSPLLEEFSGPKSVMDVKDIDMSQVATPEVVPRLESYTVEAGDNLEKILKERVLGESGLDDKQKLTKIYNLLSSVDGKKALAELGIDNVNKIAIGQNIDVLKLKELLK